MALILEGLVVLPQVEVGIEAHAFKFPSTAERSALCVYDVDRLLLVRLEGELALVELVNVGHHP